MQTPLNVGRNYITPKAPLWWRKWVSCRDYQYPFTMSRRLRESERIELFNQLNVTLKLFTIRRDRLHGTNT